MVFNIEEGGEGVALAKAVEAIQAVDPDIVALQEAVTNTGRIAAALGWDFASVRSQVISRFPIIEPVEGVGVYVLVEVRVEEGRLDGDQPHGFPARDTSRGSRRFWSAKNLPGTFCL